MNHAFIPGISTFGDNILVGPEAATSDGATYFTQADFDDGTCLIDSPGLYKLSENIVFNPNSVASLHAKYPDHDMTSYDVGDVLPQQFCYYDPAAFGFFAAIAVCSCNVTIDLNGHIIEQSVEHGLQMRFFTLVQLNSAPFMGGSGPHKFVGHGGLRGLHTTSLSKTVVSVAPPIMVSWAMTNVNVTIKDVKFGDFEIAAIHLNGAKDVLIENCKIKGNQNDIPILIYGTFSAG